VLAGTSAVGGDCVAPDMAEGFCWAGGAGAAASAVPVSVTSHCRRAASFAARSSLLPPAGAAGGERLDAPFALPAGPPAPLWSPSADSHRRRAASLAARSLSVPDVALTAGDPLADPGLDGDGVAAGPFSNRALALPALEGKFSSWADSVAAAGEPAASSGRSPVLRSPCRKSTDMLFSSGLRGGGWATVEQPPDLVQSVLRHRCWSLVIKKQHLGPLAIWGGAYKDCVQHDPEGHGTDTTTTTTTGIHATDQLLVSTTPYYAHLSPLLLRARGALQDLDRTPQEPGHYDDYHDRGALSYVLCLPTAPGTSGTARRGVGSFAPTPAAQVLAGPVSGVGLVCVFVCETGRVCDTCCTGIEERRE